MSSRVCFRGIAAGTCLVEAAEVRGMVAIIVGSVGGRGWILWRIFILLGLEFSVVEALFESAKHLRGFREF